MAPFVKKCSYVNCESTSRSSELRFFHFPKKTYKEWIKACCNPTLASATEAAILKKRYVCELHFSRYDYAKFVSPFKRNSRLVENAIPKPTGIESGSQTESLENFHKRTRKDSKEDLQHHNSTKRICVEKDVPSTPKGSAMPGSPTGSASKRSPISGSPKRSAIPGTSKQIVLPSTSTGLATKRSAISGTPKRSAVSGTPKRSAIPGTSKQIVLPSTPTGSATKRSAISGTPKRSAIPGTPKRSAIPGTSKQFVLPSTPKGSATTRSAIYGTPKRSAIPGTSKQIVLPSTPKDSAQPRTPKVSHSGLSIIGNQFTKNCNPAAIPETSAWNSEILALEYDAEKGCYSFAASSDSTRNLEEPSEPDRNVLPQLEDSVANFSESREVPVGSNEKDSSKKKTTIRRRLFQPRNSTPVKFENERLHKVARPAKSRKQQKRRTGKVLYRRVNISDYMASTTKYCNKYLSTIIHMEIMKKTKKRINYTFFQKWLSANILLSTTQYGYALLRQLLALPSVSTIKQFLYRYKMPAGVRKINIQTMKTKLHLKTDIDKLCFILMDEMSVREGYTYDQHYDKIYGFEDYGGEPTEESAKQALCVMVVGAVKKWKYPVGYYLTRNGIKSENLQEIIGTTIKLLKDEGFIPLGLTTDQGGNILRTFKELGCTSKNPKIEVNGDSYYVLHDAPHLLKSSRNMLFNKKKPLYVPTFQEPAKWSHIEAIFHMDSQRTLKLVPKLNKNNVLNLSCGAKMKVKKATCVMSNTCAAAINLSVESNAIESSAKATSTYIKLMNDLFDVFNGSISTCKVPLRRPVSLGGKAMKFLDNAMPTLLELDDINCSRRVKFIKGWIQNITAVKGLLVDLQKYNVKYLSLRNLCQDPLELLFSKIRQLAKYPNSKSFADMYAKTAISSLLKAPLSANCEDIEQQQLEETNFLGEISPPPIPEVPILEIEDIASVLNYMGGGKLGGIDNDWTYDNCVSYFSGFIANKLNDQHLRLMKSPIQDCDICCNILEPKSLDRHLFIIFKEYCENGNLD